MLSRVPSPSARVRFAASRPCPGRRGRAVLVAVGVAGGVWSPPPVAGSGARLVSRSGCVGVCRGCSVSLFRLRAGRSRRSPFRPVPGRALGRFRPGPVVPPFAALAVRVRRGRAVFLVRRRVAFRAVVGSPLAGPPRLLRRACGLRWVCGFRAGLPVRAAVPVGVAPSAGCPCGLGGALWPLSRFVVLLPAPCPCVGVLCWLLVGLARSLRVCCFRLLSFGRCPSRRFPSAAGLLRLWLPGFLSRRLLCASPC
jgi:hypothetical protein